MRTAPRGLGENFLPTGSVCIITRGVVRVSWVPVFARGVHLINRDCQNVYVSSMIYFHAYCYVYIPGKIGIGEDINIKRYINIWV